MFNRIQHLSEKKLCGLSQKMSLTRNTTGQLWRSFMQMRKSVPGAIGEQLYSMQVYDNKPDFNHFNPNDIFTKWAGVEVSDHVGIPAGLSPYTLKGGLYAVFIHQGTADQFQRTFGYIFQQWLPGSGYQVDHREHFELLPKNYRPDDPEAIEEIWIPVISENLNPENKSS